MREPAWAAYKASPAHDRAAQGVRGQDGRDQRPHEPLSLAARRREARRTAGPWSSRCTAAAARRKRVNDQQWQSMFERYYKDHPEAGGYVYLALRRPTTSGTASTTTRSARWSSA